MRTREIPHAEWTHFADAFSRKHAGWLVTLETLDPALGAQEIARDIPLGGITADREPGHDEITILLAESPERHAAHRIVGPVHLYLLQNDEGADEALEAETGSGGKTILRFRSPMPPEMVDGLVP
jgi:Family of unknown function (DUF5335)